MQISLSAKNIAGTPLFFNYSDLHLSGDTTTINNHDIAINSGKKKKWRHYRRGDTLVYCDILQLDNIDYRHHVFAVFGFVHIHERRSRSKLKIKYVLNRESHYLSTIFYTKAIRIERKRIDIDYNLYLKQLEKKYPTIRLWGILDANAIGNVITRK